MSMLYSNGSFNGGFINTLNSTASSAYSSGSGGGGGFSSGGGGGRWPVVAAAVDRKYIKAIQKIYK